VKRLAVAFPIVILLASCAAYQAQHGGTDVNTTRSEEAAKQLPADPKVVASFDSQPLGLKQAVLISELDRYRDELKANGKYDCCVKPACRQCAMSAGECHCRKVIDANGPCCGECTQAWVEGRGNAVGIDREKVLAHLGCVRELYDKKTPEGMTAPGQPEAKPQPQPNDH
jgi:hypothetical protein